MADEKMTESRPVETVTVAIVGTGDGGRLPSGTEAETPGKHQPNLVVQVVRPIVALVIRFINAYVTGLVGILSGAMASDIIPANDFLDLLQKCAGLALAGAVVGLLKNIVTVFTGLEQRAPLSTGNV